MAKDTYFRIFTHTQKTIDRLTDEEAGKIFKGLYAHTVGTSVKFDNPATEVAFYVIADQIDRDQEKYNTICKQNRENAKLRWEKEGKCDPMRPHTTATDTMHKIEDRGEKIEDRGEKIEDRGEKEEDNILLSSNDDTNEAFDYQAIIDSFNAICKSLPHVKKLTKTRERKIKSVSSILEESDLTFEDLFNRVEGSDFLTGRSGKDWKADFDFILQPQKTVKIIEGSYDNKQPSPVELDYSGGF